MRYLKDERGYAIPVVLLVLLVFTFLGTALWHYSIADTAQVERDEKKAQAYYIARSGADTIAEYIIKNPLSADDLINAPASQRKALGSGSFSVDVSGSLNPFNIAEEVIVESTGEVDGISKTVVLTVVSTDAFGNFALFGNIIDVSGNSAKVYGDIIYTNDDYTDYKEKILKDGSQGTHDPDRYYPPAEFPEGLPLRSDIVLTSTHDSEYVDQDGEYALIDISGGELTFGLSGGNDLQIYAHDMKVTGNGVITLAGSGRLLLYVDNYTGGGTIKMDPDPDSDVSLIVFVKPGGTFDLAGTPNFWGAIYAPEADVILSGTSTLTGSIIADNIRGNGTFTVKYEEIDAGNLPIASYTRGTWQWKD